MSTTNRSKGFTVLELLIALTLSVMVLTGVYTTFDSLLNTKSATEESYYRNNLLLSARSAIKPDMLQMHFKTLSIKHEKNDTLSFRSNNSIKMEKAFPVDVKYYVEDGYLIREESSDEHDYSWKMLLIGNVDKFSVQSHNGYRFVDDVDELDTIIKISMTVSDSELTFIAGAGHTSKNTSYTGASWN